ncbi:hypothetical protein [Oceanobacillus bengalensis]|uniref:Uncharacterized protein n=1 Tax=Oceanobacillus bengalensis TaxID=1435466 RepID=A0A494YSU9_9BACI|nr:hypothetical protein D8M05_17210 [Oceanobacillus bengalensis]
MRKEVFSIQLIISYIALGIITALSIDYLVNNWLFGIILMISLWISYNYIKNLETQSKIEIKMKKIGIICYFLTVTIALPLVFCVLV